VAKHSPNSPPDVNRKKEIDERKSGGVKMASYGLIAVLNQT
jgi:hypothetical protein